MNAKKSKKVLLLASLSTLAVSTAAVLAISFNSESAFRAKAFNYDELSTTFNANSTVVSGSIQSSNCVLASSLQISGIEVRATIFNSSTPGSGAIARFADDNSSVSFSIYSNSAGVTKFQRLESISFGYLNSYNSGSFKVMWSKNNDSWTTISVDSGSTNQALPSGAHYLKVVNDDAFAQFTSFTLNYSCSETPTPDSYGITYCGYDFSEYEEIPLEGIDTTSLEDNAVEGSTVSLTPVVLSGYSLVSVFEYGDPSYVSDLSFNDGVVSFTMPSHDIKLALVTLSSTVTLSSISLSGQTTEFTVGDTFSFGGTVTAYYSDSSEANVTSSTTFTGYDMSVAGEYTVTASYTEGGITKTDTYSIVVTSGSTEVALSGTYAYSSRAVTSPDTTHKDWTGCMTISFSSDGTCSWRNVRTSTLGSFDCEVRFTYIAINNGANITISMSISGYTFTKNGESNNQASSFSGGSYDRPVDAGFTVSTAKNNSGVMTLDRSSLSICTYDQANSYAVWDTLTFSLAA